MKNVFYFRRICQIGGTEQFLYEIAKKYHLWDITIYFDEADKWQLNRLRKYVRCIRRIPGERVKCDKAFLNFNIDMINDLDCDNIYFVCHAIFVELGYRPPTHPKIKGVIAVSYYAQNSYFEHEGIMPEVCYNPLTLEEKEKVIHLVAATRLNDATKGGDRMIKFIRACDSYCERTGRHYIFHIFANGVEKSPSKNVCIMEPRVDVRPYIADSDYLVQLSNNMETYCYSINEALGYGVPVITTPLTVMNELPISDDMRLILDWDMKNVDDVVKDMFERERVPFKYTPPSDRWDEILEKGESTYMADMKKKYVVKAVDFAGKVIDKYTGTYWKPNIEYTIDAKRMQEIEDFEDENPTYCLVDVIKVIDIDGNESKPKRRKKRNEDSQPEDQQAEAVQE